MTKKTVASNSTAKSSSIEKSDYGKEDKRVTEKGHRFEFHNVLVDDG